MDGTGARNSGEHRTDELMEVQELLDALAAGRYDGERMDRETNGVAWYVYIDNGTPVEVREGPSTKFFDGKENVRARGRRDERRYESDEEKIAFLQKYGYRWEMFGEHPEVMAFSRAYYDARGRRQTS